MSLVLFVLLSVAKTQAALGGQALGSCALHTATGVGYTAGGDFFGEKKVQVVFFESRCARNSRSNLDKYGCTETLTHENKQTQL